VTLTLHLTNLLTDVHDTNEAILRAKADKVVELCTGCGTITVKSPCPKCKRKKENKND
jgi:hypothetical protein